MEQRVAGFTNTLKELNDKFTHFLSSNTSPTSLSTSIRRSETASSLSSTRIDPTLHPPAEVHSPSRETLTVPHRVILWPCIWQLLADSDLDVESDLRLISEEGNKGFVRKEMAKHPHSLPHDTGMSSSAPPNLGGARTDSSLNLNIERMRELTDAYFRTFNVLLPILGYDVFVSTTLEKLASQGFAEGDLDTVLALLVFALGELASEGTFGQPVSVHNGVSSGFRGGKICERQHPSDRLSWPSYLVQRNYQLEDLAGNFSDIC